MTDRSAMGLFKKAVASTVPKRLRRLIRRARRKLLNRLSPANASDRRKRRWARTWSREDHAPAWRITRIPHELQEAVDSGWFRPGASALDIGCGSGEIAAWLAEQGFNVLGIDFAEGAIARAQAQYSRSENGLAFRVVDICHEAPAVAPFEVLVDRGCLHTIPTDFAANYAQHVAPYAAEGARFLLFHKVRSARDPAPDPEARDQIARHIESTFQDLFEIERMEPTMMYREAGKKPQAPVPGLAVWMTRL